MHARSGLSLPRGTVPQPTLRAARLRAGEPGSWFEATGPFGPLHLCVAPARPGADHAAGAALALRTAEPLLAALDDALGLELDWRWIAAPPPPQPGAAVAAAWQGDAAQLSLPWPMLRALPEPPPGLDFPIVPAELALDRFALAPDELASLETGGAVLLPASLRETWTGRLRAVGESVAGVAVDLSDPTRPRLAAAEPDAAPEAEPPGRVPCELRLDLPLGVLATRLAGWRREGDAGEIVRLADNGLRATLWCLSGEPQPIAAGSLMPWGDGWALAIESTGDAPKL